MSSTARTLNKVKIAWGEPLPIWVKCLAKACGIRSLRQVALDLGVSAALVSLALNNKHRCDKLIKAKVEAYLMQTTLLCPILGTINQIRCREEQNKPFNAANPIKVRLYRECNNCEHKEKSNAV